REKQHDRTTPHKGLTSAIEPLTSDLPTRAANSRSEPHPPAPPHSPWHHPCRTPHSPPPESPPRPAPHPRWCPSPRRRLLRCGRSIPEPLEIPPAFVFCATFRG